jgi:hypothetical protein
VSSAAPASILALLALACVGARANEALPDPMRPPTTHADAVRRLSIEQPQQFAVRAIKIAAGQRKALVNERLVGVGDRIGEARVVEINPGVVVIDYLSQRLQVPLLAAPVRRVARSPEPATP